MPCDQYIINGPPNEPVLFCSLGLPASIVCCRLYRCRRAAGRPRGRSGGRHSIAGQYCYVPSGRQLVLICKNKKRVGQNYRGALSSSTCNMWYNFYDATRQVPATIGWVVYEQAWPGRYEFIARFAGFCCAGPGRILGKTRSPYLDASIIATTALDLTRIRPLRLSQRRLRSPPAPPLANPPLGLVRRTTCI